MSTTDREIFFRVGAWSEAVELTKGYEDAELLNNYIEQVRKNPPWEHLDSNYFFTSREIELICAIQKALTLVPVSLTNVQVLDVGGGNGYLGIAVKRMIALMNWDWIVLESKACARAYSPFANEAKLRWVDDESFDWKQRSTIGLFSCPLQYLENPEESLRKIADHCDFVILMRMPLLDCAKHIITRQTLDSSLISIENASWPHWFFPATI